MEEKGLRQAVVARGRDTCLRERMLSNRSNKAQNLSPVPTTGTTGRQKVTDLHLLLTRRTVVGHLDA